jgi:DNA-3-methyladenine glycosylase
VLAPARDRAPAAPASSSRRLTRNDLSLGPAELAQFLIGRRLVRVLPSGERLSGLIVETEAYLGVPDRAAHSYGGRRTPRTEPMFGPPGTAYVYFTYGMHHCMNVAAAPEGDPVAVLLRALEPQEGLETMARHRAGKPGKGGRAPAVRPEDLCSGPGKLCQALAVDRSFSGVDLTTSPDLFLEEGAGPTPPERLVNTPRIGVAYAGEWAAMPLRWYLEGSPHVSRP